MIVVHHRDERIDVEYEEINYRRMCNEYHWN